MSISPETWRAIVSGERGGLKAFLLRRGLWLARLPYGVGVWGRNKLFDWGWNTIERVGVPVICIGNLTLGGTGKTPCVEYVARFYRQREKQVAILSRGYGAGGGGSGRNDEAMLLEENLPDVPHLQSPDRAMAARLAIEELDSEVLVLDDGFQHRRLHRDLDVVLIDATNPWGYGYLFPRGALREPVSGLKRAHAVMITRADRAAKEEIEAIQRRVLRVKQLPISLTRHAPIELIGTEGRTGSLEELRGRPVAAFCGIGNPEAFRQTLADLGANVTEFRSYADHHNYTRQDVDDLRQWTERLPNDAVIATTQKDWVKLRIGELAGRLLWAVRIGIEFLDGCTQFDELLAKVIGNNP